MIANQTTTTASSLLGRSSIFDDYWGWGGYCPHCDPTPRCPCCGRPLRYRRPYWKYDVYCSSNGEATKNATPNDCDCELNANRESQQKYFGLN